MSSCGCYRGCAQPTAPELKALTHFLDWQCSCSNAVRGQGDFWSLAFVYDSLGDAHDNVTPALASATRSALIDGLVSRSPGPSEARHALDHLPTEIEEGGVTLAATHQFEEQHVRTVLYSEN